MTQDRRAEVVKTQEGESLKLNLPGVVEFIIKVDPRRTGSPFTMGTQTIAPGGAIPMHRHRHQDEVLFVHKGQGRAILEGRVVTVVPGVLVYVPRDAWHGLRNTGTGLLQVTWTVVPSGIEEFFRELSRLSGPADSATLQAIAQRHGIEFRPEREPAEAAAKAVPAHRGRRRRGGRRHRHGGKTAPPAPVPQQPAQTTQQSLQAARPPAPVDRSRQRGRFRHRRHVRRVYMGGRWIEVEGEGPVIAPGKESTGHRPKDRQGEEGGPRGPLSVPL